jgi:hypothetical protein
MAFAMLCIQDGLDDRTEVANELAPRRGELAIAIDRAEFVEHEVDGPLAPVVGGCEKLAHMYNYSIRGQSQNMCTVLYCTVLYVNHAYSRVCVCVNTVVAPAMVLLMKATAMIDDDVYQSAGAEDVEGDGARTVQILCIPAFMRLTAQVLHHSYCTYT